MHWCRRVGINTSPPTDLTTRPNSQFIYGDRDWMDIRPAQRIKRRLAQDPVSADRVVRCFELEEAGHQLMIDQPDSFNDILLKVSQRGRATG